MAKFRKRTVVIEAVIAIDLMRAAKNDWDSLPDWFRQHYESGGVVITDEGIYLPTLEGTMFAQPYDWVIRGVKNEVYPCRDDIFRMTYEPA
jgi:hypothetical protein